MMDIRILLIWPFFIAIAPANGFATPVTNSRIHRTLRLQQIEFAHCTRTITPKRMIWHTEARGPSSSLSALRGGSFPFPLHQDSYFLTRIVFLRALGFVYSVAFLVAKHQNRALIGDDGITPARNILDAAEERGKLKRQRRQEWLNNTFVDGPKYESISKNPFTLLKKSKLIHDIGMKVNRNTLFQDLQERLWYRSDGGGRPVTTLLWLAKDRNKLNPWLNGIATCGLAMSFAMFVMGATNVPLLLATWLCHRSLMAVGGPWYGYGWEPQLAELGFHALFLVPLLSLNPLDVTAPPNPVVIFAIRWYLFRIMMGAGLIKLRSGDPKWKWPKLSTMNYFYETQPVPNPLTRYLHWMPTLWHQGEVLTNHFVEIIAPWLLLAPIRSWRRLGGLMQIAFQGFLILSGNLSFLNWLTAVPAIVCLDDAYLGKYFSPGRRHVAAAAASMMHSSRIRKVVSLLFGLLIAKLSIPVVKNLLSKYQLMNASFDPLRLVNTYGAFGTVDEEREEFIVSAASDWDGPWKEYEFKVKPGDVMRRPRFISPYHYRLDWQFWIASVCRTLDRSPWVFKFLLKLLERDPDVIKLLANDPFSDSDEGPKYIRIEKYKYKFKIPDHGSNELQPYWERKFIGRVYPRQGVATKEKLQQLLDTRSTPLF